jgi:hypothetical protein
MDGKIKIMPDYNGERRTFLYIKKSFDEDFRTYDCCTRLNDHDYPMPCSRRCIMFGEPKTTADDKTELDICQGKTLIFNTFTIE